MIIKEKAQKMDFGLRWLRSLQLTLSTLLMVTIKMVRKLADGIS